MATEKLKRFCHWYFKDSASKIVSFYDTSSALDDDDDNDKDDDDIKVTFDLKKENDIARVKNFLWQEFAYDLEN